MREARPRLLSWSWTRPENLLFESGCDPFGGSARSTWGITCLPVLLVRTICWIRSPLLQRIVMGWLCVCKTFHEEHERSFTHQGLSLADKTSTDWVNRKAVQEQKATQPFLESHGSYSPGSLYFKLVCYLAKTQYLNHLQLFLDKKSCERADFLPTQPLKTKLKL